MSTPMFDGLEGEALLHALEQEAVKGSISDIHLHPEKNHVCVQWRELGILKTIKETTHESLEVMIRRIKFQAKLKLNITNIPQDGQYTFIVDGRSINVRVATLPSRFGEAYTLRILDPKKGIAPLETLGFPSAIEKGLRSLVDLPSGLILVTGPTGSGKTTTLYALLASLQGKEQNIVTLEDPIEYELEGITQSEVDAEHGYTFATGLRSILRHDPDIILVGEIRDTETAETAIDASLTGHLVLATLHTNSAIEAIPRLLSMGVSTYTCAPALRGILAQRLVRTIAPNLRESLDQHDEKEEGFYTGMTTLPELLIVSPALQSLILNQATSEEILEAARKEGYMTMGEWGETLVRDKRTTRSEIARVTV